jgi:hypothetical protein
MFPPFLFVCSKRCGLAALQLESSAVHGALTMLMRLKELKADPNGQREEAGRRSGRHLARVHQRRANDERFFGSI